MNRQSLIDLIQTVVIFLVAVEVAVVYFALRK